MSDRPLLSDMFDLDELEEEIKGEWVTRKRHPTHPVSIYTYTHATQKARRWNLITRNCRGLVADDNTGEVVAFPFPKFFTTGAHLAVPILYGPLPEEPYEVYEKLDGSLAVVFHYAGEWIAASKASFISDQAQWAQRYINWEEEGLPVTRLLRPGYTYLAEIIYPANRIVVDYGDTSSLTLLGVYGPDGYERPLPEGHRTDWAPIGPVVVPVASGPAAGCDSFSEVAEITKFADGNTAVNGEAVTGTSAEGYVIRYASGIRVKVKFEDYQRLHWAMTDVNARDIWRCLFAARNPDMPVAALAQLLHSPQGDILRWRAAPDGPLAQLLGDAPAEFVDWVQNTCVGLDRAAENLVAQIDVAFGLFSHLKSDRKAFADAIRVFDRFIREGVFLRLDGKPLDGHVWREVMPAASLPFRTGGGE